jgi:hypothetical protein
VLNILGVKAFRDYCAQHLGELRKKPSFCLKWLKNQAISRYPSWDFVTDEDKPVKNQPSQ